MKGQKFINQPYQVLSAATMQEIAAPLCPWSCPKEIESAMITQQGKGGYQELIKIDCIFNTALCLSSLKMFVQARVFLDLK